MAATAAGVLFTRLWGTEDANAFAGIGSFVLAAVALILALVPLLPKRTAVPRPASLAARLLHVDDRKLPRVSQLDDRRFGVRPAVESAEHGPTQYLVRDIEAAAAQAMRAGRMVVFTGPATAGKSRTAVQLVKQLFPDRYLYVPSRADSLSALLDEGHKFSDAVIWLDDLERYFGDRGVDLGLLSRLCLEGRTDVVVVATLRHLELGKHGVTEDGPNDSQKYGQTKPHPSGTDLLKHLKKREQLFAVAAELSSSEAACLDELDSDDGDTRLRAAAESGRGFGEYLGAGVEMTDRWIGRGNALETVGAAVISAAVDARRAGYSGVLPAESLAELADNYLPESLRTRADAPSPQQGIEWAVRPVAGTDTSSCLIPHTDGGYQAEDYLADRAETPPSPLAGQAIPGAVWRVVLSLADSDQAMDVGFAAQDAGEPDVEFTAVSQAAIGGQASGMYNLAILLEAQGTADQAEQWYRKAAGTGHINAKYNLASLLYERGKTDEAEDWYRQAADSGDTGAVFRLGVIAYELDRGDEAERWYRKAADTGHLGAVYNLGVLFHDARPAEAETWYRKAADAGSIDAMSNLGMLLDRQGRPDEAETWYRKAADAGNIKAMNNLGLLLDARGEPREAESWYRRAAQSGDLHATYNLGILLETRGDTDEAETHYRRAAETGFTDSMINLGNLLKKRGELAEAEIWYRKAAEAEDVDAMYNLGLLLETLGDSAEAVSWFRQAADAGEPDSAAKLAELRHPHTR